MQQYREAKDAFPDAILFFRLGDFYEMFNDDAVVCARELGLNLTSRNKGAPGEVPMAGVPHHAAHNYLARLIAAGHKVAICEQIGDPSKIKGIVPRKVVRVLTPGLITDTEQLDARRNNYLVAIDGDGLGSHGFAQLDLSTGELGACVVEGHALLVAEVARADPAEVLLDERCFSELAEAVKLAAPRAALRPDDALGEDVGAELDAAVSVPLAEEAGRVHPPLAVRAAARCMRFARRYLPEAELPVTRVGRHDPNGTLRIDETAQTHLELVRGAEGGRSGSLLAAIDETVTAGGARLLRRQLLAPLVEVAAIRRRLDAVELFVTHPRARDELREALGRIGDIERLAIRASLREVTPRELGTLRDSLAAAPTALSAMRAIPETPGSACEALQLDVDLLEPLAAHLERALVEAPPAHARDGGMISPGYDEALDECKSLRRGGSELVAELEARLRDVTEVPSLKVKYTRAFGWYIEVTKANLSKVPDDWRRKQTLRQAERYTTDELDELAERVVSAEERHSERESELFAELIERVAADAEALRRLAGAIAQWDVSAALALTAHMRDYVRPDVDDSEVLALSDARHPVVERHVARGCFVPNDTTLDCGAERLLIVTGPNMAGKSTLMRQVALVTILAQMGSFVPAAAARIGVVDRVLSRVGASDNLARGESTFMVEMRETATILRDATARSLVILDEIGRGTSTYDGLAIAWSVAEYLHDHIGCRAMFATHYHKLTELAEDKDGLANYSVSAREHEGDVIFLHRLTPGSVSRSFGIAVARLAGLPEAVLGRANVMLAELELSEGATNKPAPQLELFAPRDDERRVCDLLRAIDVERMTPLEALQLLSKLSDELDG